MINSLLCLHMMGWAYTCVVVIRGKLSSLMSPVVWLMYGKHTCTIGLGIQCAEGGGGVLQI